MQYIVWLSSPCRKLVRKVVTMRGLWFTAKTCTGMNYEIESTALERATLKLARSTWRNEQLVKWKPRTNNLHENMDITLTTSQIIEIKEKERFNINDKKSLKRFFFPQTWKIISSCRINSIKFIHINLYFWP